jgi:hypothetical protein
MLYVTGTLLIRGVHAVRHGYLCTNDVVLVAYSCTPRVGKNYMPRISFSLVVIVISPKSRDRYKDYAVIHVGKKYPSQ